MEVHLKTDAPTGRAGRYPEGLFYLAFTEAWERFSFYGTRALLILYMIEHLLVNERGGTVIGLDALRNGVEAILGPVSDQAFASQLFGLYAGLVYFTPIFGGLLGDRLLGQRRTVLLGAGMMAAGHLLMAWETAFIIALLLLLVGCGCLKGNITAQVGNLYHADDPRRTDGFALFTVGINTGAFLAPIVCGALAKFYGWHIGFGAAALGMAIGAAIYVAGWDKLPPDRLALSSERTGSPNISRTGWRALSVPLLILFVGIFYTIAYSQAFNMLILWVRDHSDLQLWGLEVPASSIPALDGLFIVVLTPLLMRLWHRQRTRGTEPDDLAKLGIGSLIGGIAYLILAVVAWWSGGAKVSLAWTVLFFAILDFAYIYHWPITLVLVSRLSPQGLGSTMMGLAFLTQFAANILAGWIGVYYEKMPSFAFWAIQAAIMGVGAMLILLSYGALSRRLGDNRLAPVVQDAIGTPTPQPASI